MKLIESLKIKEKVYIEKLEKERKRLINAVKNYVVGKNKFKENCLLIILSTWLIYKAMI